MSTNPSGKMMRLGNKMIPKEHFSTKRKRSKKGKIERALKAEQPKLIEDPKRAMYFRGLRASEPCVGLMKDLYSLQKPHGVLMQKRNPILPFEDTSSIEFLADKNKCSLFFETNTNKKRPDNIMFGRLFDGQVLDIAEFGLKAYGSMEDITKLNSAPQPRNPSKPIMVFNGDAWVNDPDMAHIQNLFQDFYRGRTMKDGLALPAIEGAPVFSFTAGEERTIHLRVYVAQLKKSGTRIPKVKLVACGPFADLTVRRSKWGDSATRAEACTVPEQLRERKSKNISKNAFGERTGTVHVGKQNIDELQTRKEKALKRPREDEPAPAMPPAVLAKAAAAAAGGSEVASKGRGRKARRR